MKRVPPALRRSLLRCLLVLGAAAAVSIGLARFAATAAADHATESARRDGLLPRRAPDDAAAALAGRAFYLELVDRGAISAGNPPDWPERLARLEDRYQLADVRYELGPERADALLPGTAAHDFMAAPMSLRLGLRHEQQLLDFLDDLVASGPGVARIKACSVARAAASEEPPGVRLVATCVIDWVSLRRKA